MEPAGDFCFLLFLLLCKCSCSYASLSCGIFCDIQYKSEQTVLFLIWWMMENIEITDPFFMTFLFLFVSCADVAGFCSPQCMLTEPLFYSMRTFTACVWFDFAGILLWLQSACDFPSVTIFQHVKDQLDFGFTRISLLHKLSRYRKDYTKFKFPCSFLCSMGRTTLIFGKKKTSEWGWLWFQYMQSIIFVYVGYAPTCICDYKVGKSSGMAWVDHCLLPELWIPLGLVT